ncbi:MAG TPA: hypothetical protein VD866_08665, partial [Urbifossiella sp.]|nr:hypothetical protein [Urbifossiella sp.]
RHLASPTAGPDGGGVVPPVTAWLFTEREHDQEAFESFLTGRHRGVFMSGDDLVEKARVAMSPFAAHPLRRVREWAAYEIDTADRHADWLRRDDEEDDRV